MNLLDKKNFILDKCFIKKSNLDQDIHFDNLIRILKKKDKNVYVLEDEDNSIMKDVTYLKELEDAQFNIEDTIVVSSEEECLSKWEGYETKLSSSNLELLKEVAGTTDGSQWLIAVDLDGTLLDSKDIGVYDDAISIDNINLIKEFVKLGHKFVISTGRSWNETKHIYEMIGSEQFIIQCAGAHIHMPEKKVIFSSPVNKDILIQMHEFINEHHDQPIALIYADELKTYFHEFTPSDLRIRLQSLQDVEERQEETFIKDNYKGSFIFNPEVSDCEKIKASLEERFPEYHWFFTGNKAAGFVGIEYNKKEINKAKAIETLSKYFGIEMSRTIAIGDGPNDREAIEASGIGIAVSNATDDIKSISDIITRTTNDERAVGIILQELFTN